jgi:tRNA(fMet)-specific endonuclease VapC
VSSIPSSPSRGPSTRSSGADVTTRLVLDTSAYAQFRGGHRKAVDHIARAESVLVPAVVLGELHVGIRLGKRGPENRVSLEEFLEEPFVSVLPVTLGVAERYGQIFSDLRKAGTPIPTNDIWIAASAIEAAGHLLTFDADFARIKRLDSIVLKP